MKHSIVQDSINGIEFSRLVDNLSKKYQFPFSEGHLRDIAISFKPENKAYIYEDLNYLNKISNGYALGTIGENETLTTTKSVNIYNFFNDLLNEQYEELEFDIFSESDEGYLVNLNHVSDRDIFKTHLEKNNSILDQKVISSVLRNLWANMDNPSVYKQFRENVSTIKSRFNSRDTILETESDYFKKILPLLDFLCSNDPLSHQDNFENVLLSFLSINGRKLDERKIGQKIELAYMLLDFHPYFMEKVNRKNRPSNIGRDCKNLFFASQAKYYVTEDKSSLRKADFVTKALTLKVKVTNMSDFLARFC